METNTSTYFQNMNLRQTKRQQGNLVIEGIPEIPVELSDRLDQYQSIREAFLVDWLKNDDGLLIATRFGESTQFHTVAHPGGVRRQVTFFSEPVYKGCVCPAPHTNGFLFAKDIGGNEAFQFYYFDLDTGAYKMHTDGISRNDHGLWSNNGRSFIYASTSRNGIDHDLFVCHPHGGGGAPYLVMQGEGYWYPVAWSPDDQFVAIAHYQSVSHHSLYILHLKSGRLIDIGCDKQNVACKGAQWSLDGKKLYYTSDEQSEHNQIYCYDFDTHSSSCLTPHIVWDVEALALSPDGHTLAFAVNENGISHLYLMNMSTYQLRPVKKIPEGIINQLKWKPSGHKLALSINRPTSPSDVYVYDLEQRKTTRWTYSETGGLDPDSFCAPQLIHYPTFDTIDHFPRLIPAYLYMPREEKQRYPVLIYIHGGPESQYRPEFSPIFQYYLNELGIAVIAPNVRGSTGYGKHFLKLDNGYKREDSVYDIGKLIDWIESNPQLDASRVAVMGGSYGGYMVLASMTHFNQRLRCGIDIVGISNFVTFLENTQSYRRDIRRIEYGDERDPSMRRHLERISPTANAHKITKPMLIVQGLNDPRVPASEAEQMLRAIRRNGGEAWYLLAKDEGHGFRKKSNRDYYSKAVILFLQRFLLE